MDWRYCTGVLCTFVNILSAVLSKGLEFQVDLKDASVVNQKLVFNASLGEGWSYFMDRNSRGDSAHQLFQLDASSGYLYIREPTEICRHLHNNPVDIKIQGRTHYHSQQTPSNYSVISLNINFHNLPCSVPKHRTTVYSSSMYSILVVIYKHSISNTEPFHCLDKNERLVNLKQFIPKSLQSASCKVTVKHEDYFYNASSSFIQSKTGHCMFDSNFKVPLVLEPCDAGHGEQISVLLDMQLNLKKRNYFVMADPNSKSSHVRLRRETKPQFTESQYTAAVPENQGIGYTVIHLTATDPDTGDAGKLTYSMTSTTNLLSNNMFTIDPISGLVTTTLSLDREQIPRHRFLVTVTDSGTLKESANAILTINVADENDHTPTFDHDVYSITPDENIAVRSVVITVQATDGDTEENANIRYSIIVPPNSETFKIDPVSGAVSTYRTLDRETQASYQLVVQAVDQAPLGQRRSSTATISVQIKDENDNVPQFSQSSYIVNVTENLDVSKRPVIIQISATDADAGDNQQIRYSITNGNSNNTFSIDHVSGEVVVQKELDYEKTREFRLRIRASDNGKITLQNSTTLWIRIEDLNDNRPYFQSSVSRGSIQEGVAIGTSVLTVQALDNDSGNNALLHYSLVDMTSAFPFSINRDSGQISVRATIDREKHESYEFKVRVVDNGQSPLSATTEVVITVNDVNDNNPIFEEKTVYVVISENTPLYRQVVQVTATDMDSPSFATLRYEITSGNARQDFSIDRTSGIIKVQNLLDYKIQNKYILTVRAYDNDDKFDSCEVHINITYINKERPVFEKADYKLSISEGLEIGTSVGRVFASDTDFGENGRVSYEIMSENTDFAIDANTGEITTREVLDRELLPGHSFDVKASDHGSPPKYDIANVVVMVEDANDNAPEFQRRQYNASVSEAAFDNTLVLTVSATDGDDGINAKITYRFDENNNGDGDFEIDESSGTIRVAKNNHIDREVKSNYTLLVLAVDSGHTPLTGTATVKVKVEDINDNAPRFRASTITAMVPENEPIGSTVAVIEATDPDEGVNAIIKYSFEGGPDADKFVLNNPPGKPAYIINHIDLDYESGQKEYIIRLKAASQTLISAANIIIKVQDVNDNAPVLKDFTIIFNNYVDHFPNKPIGRVPAFDPDVSDQSKLTYKFLRGNEPRYLILNETSGEITLNSTLNSDVPRNGSIQVRVSGKCVSNYILNVFQHVYHSALGFTFNTNVYNIDYDKYA